MTDKIQPTGLRLPATSYAILGMLAVRPWSAYELTKQIRRSLEFGLRCGCTHSQSLPTARYRLERLASFLNQLRAGFIETYCQSLSVIGLFMQIEGKVRASECKIGRGCI